MTFLRGQLTSDGLSSNGGVVMGMVTRVEKMVVQSSVKPVIEKLDRTNMKQRNNNDVLHKGG